MELIPAVIYVNQTLKISCNVSTFYFAYGTVLTTGGKPENISQGIILVFSQYMICETYLLPFRVDMSE